MHPPNISRHLNTNEQFSGDFSSLSPSLWLAFRRKILHHTKLTIPTKYYDVISFLLDNAHKLTVSNTILLNHLPMDVWMVGWWVEIENLPTETDSDAIRLLT